MKFHCLYKAKLYKIIILGKGAGLVAAIADRLARK